MSAYLVSQRKRSVFLNSIKETCCLTWTPFTPISVMSSVKTPGSLSAKSFSCLIHTESAMPEKIPGSKIRYSFKVILHTSLTDRLSPMVVHESPSAMTVVYEAHMTDHAQHLLCIPALANISETK